MTAAQIAYREFCQKLSVAMLIATCQTLGMGVIQYIIICVVIGIVVWLVHAFTPIPAPFKKLILWAGVIVCVVLLANALGLFGHDIAIPKIR